MNPSLNPNAKYDVSKYLFIILLHPLLEQRHSVNLTLRQNLFIRSDKCCKTFYACNLQMFVISYSVCTCRAFPALSTLPKSVAPERCFTQVASALPRKHFTRLERLAKDEHSSFYEHSLITDVRSLITLSPGLINIC
jgi:hypothetical protein